MISIMRIAQRFRADRDGVSAVEFALILPLMITLYLGSVEVSQAISVKRKVTLTASSLADLVARAETVSNAEMDDIMEAASAVMTPYRTDPIWIRVSSIDIDGDGDAQVAWSDGRGAAPHGAGDGFDVPDEVRVPDTSLVVAEVGYAHTPSIGYVITGTLNLTDTFYLRPRINSRVCRQGVAC